MRPINADALIDKYQSECSVDVYRYEVIEDLRNAPTVDAVPVIRCKDCKHWPINQLKLVPMTGKPVPEMWSYLHCEGMGARDFCSKGEPKDND